LITSFSYVQTSLVFGYLDLAHIVSAKYIVMAWHGAYSVHIEFCNGRIRDVRQLPHLGTGGSPNFLVGGRGAGTGKPPPVAVGRYEGESSSSSLSSSSFRTYPINSDPIKLHCGNKMVRQCVLFYRMLPGAHVYSCMHVYSCIYKGINVYTPIPTYLFSFTHR